METPGFTLALSVAKAHIMPSPGHAKAVNDFLQILLPPNSHIHLSLMAFTDVPHSTISFIPTQKFSVKSSLLIMQTHLFALLLNKHNLTTHHPDLVTNLRHGFPLSSMPELLSTHILRNHPTVNKYPSTVDNYIAEELSTGRMSGPFSQVEVENILRGPFHSSPFIVAVQPQGPGEPDKLRVCCHLSKSTKLTPSVNSFISKDDFSTRFNTASRIADTVSSHSISQQPIKFASQLRLILINVIIYTLIAFTFTSEIHPQCHLAYTWAHFQCIHSTLYGT